MACPWGNYLIDNIVHNCRHDGVLYNKNGQSTLRKVGRGIGRFESRDPLLKTGNRLEVIGIMQNNENRISLRDLVDIGYSIEWVQLSARIALTMERKAQQQKIRDQKEKLDSKAN